MTRSEHFVRSVISKIDAEKKAAARGQRLTALMCVDFILCIFALTFGGIVTFTSSQALEVITGAILMVSGVLLFWNFMVLFDAGDAV